MKVKRFDSLKPDGDEDLPRRVSVRVFLAMREAEFERERRSRRRLAFVVWSVLFFAAASVSYSAGLLIWWLWRHKPI